MDLSALVGFHFAQTDGPHVSMSLYRVPNPWECGIVKLNERGEVTRFVEKPAKTDVFSDLANAGVLVMDPQLLKYIPADCFYDFGRDLLPRFLQLGVPVFGWPLRDSAYLIDIGALEKYNQAQREWPTPTARRFL
jgi:NDP-sugar pyrophosphorylase family protein